MPDDDEDQLAGVKTQEVFLDQAKRRWDVEEENARRHFNRTRLLAGVSVGVVGLLINALARLLESAAWWFTLLVVLLFFLGTLFFVVGYWQLLNPRNAAIRQAGGGRVPTERRSASELLALFEEDLGPAEGMERTTAEATSRCKVATHDAALALQAQNQMVREGIATAGPTLAVVLALMVFVLLASIALVPLFADN